MLSRKENHLNIPMRTGCRRVGATVLSAMIALVLLAGFPVVAGAHSPKEVALSYDDAKHTLAVRITHPSQSSTVHYVKKVEIKKNDQTVSVTEYQSQPTQDTFTYDYPVEIGPGDSVEVKATCNIFGSKTTKLDLPKSR